MRHVPEDELHAYLDQALSRSQCIEIETHLAVCGACQVSRDTVAGLRDRTTALLARAVPARRLAPPPLAELQARRAAARAAWRRPAIWAASVAGALLAGWTMRAAFDPHRTVPFGLAAAPAAAEVPAEPEDSATVAQAPAQPVRMAVATPRAQGRAESPPGASPPDLVVSSPATPPLSLRPAPTSLARPASLALDSRWEPVTMTEAEQATGGLVPLVPDLPVSGISLLPAGASERPILLIAQGGASDPTVYVLEGPVEEVADVLSTQLAGRPGLAAGEPSRSPPDYIESGATFRRTSRVLVLLGALTADSLTSLAQRVVLR